MSRTIKIHCARDGGSIVVPLYSVLNRFWVCYEPATGECRICRRRFCKLACWLSTLEHPRVQRLIERGAKALNRVRGL